MKQSEMLLRLATELDKVNQIKMNESYEIRRAIELVSNAVVRTMRLCEAEEKTQVTEGSD